MGSPDLPFRSVNPATGEIVEAVPFHEQQEVEARLERASQALRTWRKFSVADRGKLLEAVAQCLEEEADRLADLACREMGKLLVAARAEVEKCAWLCRFFGKQASDWLASHWIAREKDVVEVRFEPLGTILLITPWNFPYWQIFRAAVPALAAGNTVLVKPSEVVPATALAVEEVFFKAGLPDGVVQLLLVPRSSVSRWIHDRRIHGVSLTGSERAGREVAAVAGAALKPLVLELGGSDPFLVFPSAKLDQALSCAVQARIQNNGQSCIAAKRFLLHETIAEEFERGLVSAFQKLRIGDPKDPATELGPLVNCEAAERLELQVQKSVAAGAELLFGGCRRPEGSAYFLPTILRNPPPGCPAFDEELFGPVATVFRFRTVQEAVELANAPGFGLGASVWTQNEAEAEELARELKAGTVVVNGMVASDPRIPFGGSGRSGFGRELGREGLLEWTHVKAIAGASGPARPTAPGQPESR
jgi:succinate-semialdehyde dehydrogenase/glutarate-semialdehyde dehydrogenase